MKRILLIIALLCLAAGNASAVGQGLGQCAWPTCSSGGGASILTDLDDVNAKQGTSMEVQMADGVVIDGNVGVFDANGNLIDGGQAPGGAPATLGLVGDVSVTSPADFHILLRDESGATEWINVLFTGDVTIALDGTTSVEINHAGTQHHTLFDPDDDPNFDHNNVVVDNASNTFGAGSAVIISGGGTLDLTDLRATTTLYLDPLIGDTTDGHKFIVHRNAAEGQDFLSFYVDSFQAGVFESTGNLTFRSTTAVKGNMILDLALGANQANQNFWFRHHGDDIGGASQNRYVQYQLNDATAKYELIRQNADVLGFDIQMPVEMDSLAVDAAVVIEGLLDIGSVDTFPATDTTPDVSGGTYFRTDGTSQSLIDFSGGVEGQLLFVESFDSTVYVCSGANDLDCGTTDITTAAGDMTAWLNVIGGTGGIWKLQSYMRQADDLGTDGGGSEINDLVNQGPPGVLTNQVFIGANAATTGTWVTVPSCGAQKLQYNDLAPNTFTCVDEDATQAELDLQDECSEITNCVVGAITGNETITLSGPVTGSGTTAITTVIAVDSINTGQLDDGSDNTPLVGEFVRIATDTNNVKYDTVADVQTDLGIVAGAITASSGDTLTNKIIADSSNSIDLSNGVVITGMSDHDIIMRNATVAFYASIPDCKDNNMLTYERATHLFGCDADDGAGGGAPISVQYLVVASDATLNAEKIVAGRQGIDIVISGGDDGNADFDLKYTDLLADQVTFAAKQCVFTTEGTSGGGFLCEGSAGSNTNEQLLLFPALDGADTTSFIGIFDSDIGLRSLTSAELDQLENIGSLTLTNTIWTALENLSNVNSGDNDEVDVVNDGEICKGDAGGNVDCDINLLSELNTALGGINLTDGPHTADQVNVVNDTQFCQGTTGDILDCDVAIIPDANLPSELAYEDEPNSFASAGTQSFSDPIQLEVGNDLFLEDADGSNTIGFGTEPRTTNILLNWDIATVNACNVLGNSGKLNLDVNGLIVCEADIGGGASLTVREVDLTPSVSSVTILEFDQADGFTVTDDTGGVVEIDLVLDNITTGTLDEARLDANVVLDTESPGGDLVGTYAGPVTLGAGVVDNAALATPQKTGNFSFVVEDPTTAESGDIQWMAFDELTITQIACSIDAGTASINIEERVLNTPLTAGVDVLSSDLVCNTTMQTACASGCDVDTITNGGVEIDDPLALTISIGTAGWVQVHVRYTVD